MHLRIVTLTLLANLASGCVDFDPAKFGPDSRSAFYIVSRGRLGNQLVGYSVVAQLKNMIDADFYITDECKKYLLEVFTEESVTLPSLQDAFCNWGEIPFEAYEGTLRPVLRNPEEFAWGKLMQLWPKNGYRYVEHECPEHDDVFFRRLTANLRATVTFRPNFAEGAQKKLLRIAKKFRKRKKLPMDSELIFVGVHVRKTDYDGYARERFGHDHITAEYFADGMRYFSKKFAGDSVVFVVASDDMDWCRKHLWSPEGDIFFAGESEAGGEGAVGSDLTLMAACNHTVVSRGSFSTYAGFLAGGVMYTTEGIKQY